MYGHRPFELLVEHTNTALEELTGVASKGVVKSTLLNQGFRALFLADAPAGRIGITNSCNPEHQAMITINNEDKKTQVIVDADSQFVVHNHDQLLDALTIILIQMYEGENCYPILTLLTDKQI